MKLILTGNPERHYNTGSYLIVTDGFVQGREMTRCYCEDRYDGCDHIVASDAPYYNQAPSLEQAREIVGAVGA